MPASVYEKAINYTNALNFTFDSSLVEMDVSGVRLRDLRPSGGLFHHKFETKDANWGSGTLTGTLVGSAAITGGKLSVLTSVGYENFTGTSNTPPANAGCVRFEFTPAYSGSYSNFWVAASQAASNINSLIRVGQVGTNIRFDLYSSSGVSLLTSQTGNTFNPVAGTTYEIELNWNGTNAWLFINGVLINGVQVMTPGTAGARGLLRFGGNYTTTPTTVMNGTLDNVVIYDAVQHTSNYTPFQVIPYQYSKDRPSVLENSSVEADALEGLAETTVTVPAGSDLEYVVNFSGADLYWDGEAWSTWTSGIPGNTLDEINDNKASLDLSAGGNLRLKTLLVSTTGAARPEAVTLTLSYNFYNTLAEPPTTTVYGFILDASGAGVSGVVVTANLFKESATDYREAASAIIGKPVTSTTDVNGRFEFDLVRTSAYEGTGLGRYVLTASGNGVNLRQINDDDDAIIFEVDDVLSQNITDKITAVAA